MNSETPNFVTLLIIGILAVVLSFKVESLEKENRALKAKIVELTTDDETGVVGHPKAVVEIQEIGVL